MVVDLGPHDRARIAEPLDRDAPPVARPTDDRTARPVGANRRPRRSRRRGLLLLLVLAVGAAVGAWAWWRQPESPRERYVTAPVERGDVEDTVTALGNLQPRDDVDVGTQVSGQLRKIYVKVGDNVKAGDLLAEIDATVYTTRVEADRAQLMNLGAQLADKQAQLQLAQQQLQRQSNLVKAKATSTDAYQSAAAAAKSAAAQVDALKAQIQQTESTLKGDQANLGYTKIYAPMAGTIVSQTAKQGQTLNANQQAPIILRIADLSTMTVWTQVSEADVAKLHLGMDAFFATLGQPDRRWYGKLQQILPTPEVVNNVVLYDALFDVPNPGQELMTQMSAQVFFVVAAAKDAVTVPAAALRPIEAAGPGGGGERRYAVTVLTPDGAAVERTVSVGVMNRASAQVLSGLQAGERVAIGTKSGSAPSLRPASSGGRNGSGRMPRLS